MKKFTKNAAALIMAMIMVFSTAGFNTAYVQAADGTVQGTLIATRDDDVIVAKPKITVKAGGDSIAVTIKKTENAEGYKVYVKAEGAQKYSLAETIELDGSAKRQIVLSGMANGTYSVRVRAYAGETNSKYSKVKTVTVDAVVPDTHAEILSSWNDDAPAKKAIVSYMQAITREGGSDYIPVENRIAVFSPCWRSWNILRPMILPYTS